MHVAAFFTSAAAAAGTTTSICAVITTTRCRARVSAQPYYPPRYIDIVLVGFKVLHLPSASPCCCERAKECRGHMRVHAPTRALAVQTLVLRWRSGTAPLSSISPISATPLASLARGLCSNFNLKDAHAPLPSRRRPLNNPPARRFCKAPISSSRPFEGNRRSSRPDLHPGFTSEVKTRRTCSEAIRSEKKIKVALLARHLSPLFDVLRALLRFSRPAAFGSRPTRKPSLQRGKSVRRRRVWEVIASRVRLGDRAAHMYMYMFQVHSVNSPDAADPTFKRGLCVPPTAHVE